MKTLLKTLITISMLAGPTAFAQKKSSASRKANVSATQWTEAIETRSNRLQADAFPLLVGGVGISFEHIFAPNVTAGAHIATMSPKNKEGSSIKFGVLTYGFQGRYFVNRNANENAMYLLGGLSLSRLQVEAQFAGTASDTEEKTTLGPLAGVGYQFMGEQMYFQIGALYTPWANASAEASSVNKQPTQISNVKVDGGLFFEGNIGWTF